MHGLDERIAYQPLYWTIPKSQKLKAFELSRLGSQVSFETSVGSLQTASGGSNGSYHLYCYKSRLYYKVHNRRFSSYKSLMFFDIV